MDNILELTNITKIFPGVRALDGVDLNVRKGTVHVLVGENGAGKSTLMKIINGEYIPETGEVRYKGKALGQRSPIETIRLGISMIRQEMNPVMEMTIGENIFLGDEPQKIRGIVDYKTLYEDAAKILSRLQISYDVRQKMSSVSIAGQQLIEIAKAINRNASVIIMDEPTSSIGEKDVDILFKQIESLKAQGISIIYITHKMDEIFRIADDITVLRDGKCIDTGPVQNYNVDKIITLMVGRKIDNIYPPKAPVQCNNVVLELKNMCSFGRFQNVSFQLKAGEILGFAGLIGAGRSEVMRAIFGLDKCDSGSLYLHGEKVKIRDSTDGVNNGIAMICEDRRKEGIIPDRSTRENITLATLKQIQHFGSISKSKERFEVQRMIEMLKIKVSTAEQKIANLSGGNQQKAIIAKWLLLHNLTVLILDEPTRGIDVGSKAEIHNLMRELANRGMAIIIISSELPEVIGMCDRVIVMHEGHITGELIGADINQESIMKLAVAN